ncbi:MAG: PIN domain-containing protein [Planctomycetota bacterium]|nr:PIN domain-containing protein [Planctomycetota bacterium]
MKAVFADTYYYLALLNRDDDAHQRVVRLSERMFAPTMTTTWVLTEVADAMAGVSQRGRFVAFLKLLRGDTAVAIVPASSELFDLGMQLYTQRPDKDWSLTDCISFVVMKQHSLTEALTADRHFEQAGFKALLR